MEIEIELPNESWTTLETLLSEFKKAAEALNRSEFDSGSFFVRIDPDNDKTILIDVPPADRGLEQRKIIGVLKNAEEELRRMGVSSLSLFGSAATAKGYPNDVDLFARLDGSSRPSVFTVSGIRLFLEERLGRRVDLITSLDASEPVPDRFGKSQVAVF